MVERGLEMSDTEAETKTIEKYNRVLVVDDEIALLQNIQDILEGQKIGFAQAENAAQALELLQNEKFDVIVCDIQMPKMNGLRFLETIRHKGDSTPVVFFSGFYESEMLKDAMKLGAYDFIEKPLEEAHLLSTLNNATEYGLIQRQMAGIADETDSKTKKTMNEFKSKINQLRVIKYSALQPARK